MSKVTKQKKPVKKSTSKDSKDSKDSKERKPKNYCTVMDEIVKSDEYRALQRLIGESCLSSVLTKSDPKRRWTLVVTKDSNVKKNLPSNKEKAKEVLKFNIIKGFASKDMLKEKLKKSEEEKKDLHLFTMIYDNKIKVSHKGNDLFLEGSNKVKVLDSVTSPNGALLVVDDLLLPGKTTRSQRRSRSPSPKRKSKKQKGGSTKKWQDGLNGVLLRNHIFNDYVKATKLIVPKEDTQNVTDMSFNGLNTNLQDYFAKRFQATPFQNYVNDTFFSGNSVENVKLILEPFQKGAFLWSDHIIKDFVKSPFYQRDFRNMVQKSINQRTATKQPVVVTQKPVIVHQPLVTTTVMPTLSERTSITLSGGNPYLVLPENILNARIGVNEKTKLKIKPSKLRHWSKKLKREQLLEQIVKEFRNYWPQTYLKELNNRLEKFFKEHNYIKFNMIETYEKQMTNLFGKPSSEGDPFVKLQLLSDPIIRGFAMSKYYPSNMYENIIRDGSTHNITDPVSHGYNRNWGSSSKSLLDAERNSSAPKWFKKQSGGMVFETVQYPNSLGNLAITDDMMFWEHPNGVFTPWDEHLYSTRGVVLRNLHPTYLPDRVRLSTQAKYLSPPVIHTPLHQIRLDIKSAYANAYPIIPNWNAFLYHDLQQWISKEFKQTKNFKQLVVDRDQDGVDLILSDLDQTELTNFMLGGYFLMKVRDEFKIIDTTKVNDDPFLKAMLGLNKTTGKSVTTVLGQGAIHQTM